MHQADLSRNQLIESSDILVHSQPLLPPDHYLEHDILFSFIKIPLIQMNAQNNFVLWIGMMFWYPWISGSPVIQRIKTPQVSLPLSSLGSWE